MTCLGWGAVHDRTMMLMALEDSGASLQHQQLSARWTAGIRAAIKAVHGAGVLHGDLHLENFVGVGPCDVKLVDFSHASTFDHSLKAQVQEEERFLLSLAQVILLFVLRHSVLSGIIESAQHSSAFICWQSSVRSSTGIVRQVAHI